MISDPDIAVTGKSPKTPLFGINPFIFEIVGSVALCGFATIIETLITRSSRRSDCSHLADSIS